MQLNSPTPMAINLSEVDILTQSQRVIEICKEKIHTWLMRQTLYSKYGRVAHTMKSSVMRSLYRELSGDESASANEHEKESSSCLRWKIQI